ncbi:Hypothetical protein SMAX5B_001154 [Scophthalmus maximus]|uniref:Uncharacterized protein n=1 Tax=Scophthalmus maximus TaxID=52904 RepID=A0A2U9CAA0_SCOMX|nr:Hypothetical protein SMAX5B_001154 [Scophthalmus maximus]
MTATQPPGGSRGERAGEAARGRRLPNNGTGGKKAIRGDLGLISQGTKGERQRGGRFVESRGFIHISPMKWLKAKQTQRRVGVSVRSAASPTRQGLLLLPLGSLTIN